MKNYAIYGDEDQEKLLALFEQEDEIQRLVDISNRQLMKDRFKDSKKRKAIVDTTKNAVRPDELPDDIKEGKPEKKKRSWGDKKEKPVKEEKKLNGSAVRKIILIFVLIVILAVVLAFRKDIANGSRIVIDKITQLIGQKEKPNDNVNPNPNPSGSGVDVVPQIPIDDDANGYMEPAADKTYTIKEVLDVANDSNTALQNYYNSLVDIANASKTSSVAEAIAKNKAMVENDRKALETYESAFAEYTSGTTYYNSLHQRFTHLEQLMEQITWVDESKIYPYINQAINEENQYIAQGKSDLINFLDVNDIPYTVNDNSVTYEVQ